MPTPAEKIKALQEVRRTYLLKAMKYLHGADKFYKYEFWNKRVQRVDDEIQALKKLTQVR